MGKQADIGEFVDKQEQSKDSKTIRLKHLAEINPTKSEISDLDPKTVVSFVALEDFGTDGEIKNTETRALDEVYDGYTYFREGDIAIAKITPSFENGKGAICRGLQNGIGFGTTELHILRPREGVSTEFLWYVLRSKPFMDEAETAMRGVAGQQRVPTEFLEEFRVTDSSEKDTEKIASEIRQQCDTIDDLIESKKRLKQRLAERRRSLISSAVLDGKGEQATTKGPLPVLDRRTPDNWEEGKLKWITKKIGSGETPDGGSESYVEEGITFIRSQNVTDRGLDLTDVAYIPRETHNEMSSTHIEPGDVLLNITGASLGRSSLVKGGVPPANVNQHVCILRPKTDLLIPAYLNFVVSSTVVQRQIFANQTGTSRDAVNFAQIGDFRVPLPPITKQKEIVSQINKNTRAIDRLSDTIDEAIATLEEKRQALITAAVTGQIDMYGT
ncbi:restriction endonuclease subunit S [Halobellus sp. GM3]|uniref:restriction endonuclease subunit S n=1 Tax=Halobellus sp. GM3 TaxID=3458410 RepID=UPI00403E2130